MKRIDINVGDVVRLKKQHPCGSFQWEIYRTGMDIGIKCLGCGRKVMVPRTKIEKNIKEFIKKADEKNDDNSETVNNNKITD